MSKKNEPDLFEFVGWVDPEKKIAKIKAYGQIFYVPRTRLIPHLSCQAKYFGKIKDPNELAIKCAEENSFFGIPIFRHILHLVKIGNPTAIEKEKVYDFPRDVDFFCVREEILKGEPTDEAIKKCRVRRI